jgi:hypothetical protein
MNATESEARRQIEARQPGQNIMGRDRFQIVHKTYKDSAIKGQPPVAITTKIGPFEPF